MPSCGVRPSVCLSLSWIMSKRINISSKFFSPSGSRTILFFLHTKRCGDIPTGTPPPNGGIECRWGIGSNCDSGLIAGYRRLLDVRSDKNSYRRPLLFPVRRKNQSKLPSFVANNRYRVLSLTLLTGINRRATDHYIQQYGDCMIPVRHSEGPP